MQGIDGDIGGRGEGGGQVDLSGIRLGQHRDFVADVGGGKAGVVHRAADGLHRGAVAVHVGVLGHLADDESVEPAHGCASFRISSSASTRDWNSGPQRRKRCCWIRAL